MTRVHGLSVAWRLPQLSGLPRWWGVGLPDPIGALVAEVVGTHAIGAADELDIAPIRPDESLRPYTTIWVVRVGDAADIELPLQGRLEEHQSVGRPDEHV